MRCYGPTRDSLLDYSGMHLQDPWYRYSNSCPPDWQLFVLWGKMARVGGFHKFLYYSIMSLVCFLHPVLVWHAVIPGTMLLVTACFNFLLTKKPTGGSFKGLHGHYDEQGLPPVGVMETGKLQSIFSSSFSFFNVGKGWRGGGDGEGRSLACAAEESVSALGEGEESLAQVMLDLEPTKDEDREKRRWGWSWRERRQVCFTDRVDPVEREMEEMERYGETDTAPMIPD
ncbi:Transmembrane protein 72 [Merluccius polli]|uniref:Transmembrane protein 72 n=1 Tax=Merluccius polli TaxID=89951 RepID=A0AA47NTI1_MERPO|nr:Transmembrane protein 72 [Merluccius polli]